MINVYELIHNLKESILFMDGQLQRANGQALTAEPPDPRTRTAGDKYSETQYEKSRE